MSTKIIMIRHGYSETNKACVFAGQSDVPLTDTGFEQARLCGEYFKPWSCCTLSAAPRVERIWDMGIGRIDAVYSSDLSRAYNTAIPVARALSLDVIKCHDLIEIFAGAWEMMPFGEIDEKYHEEFEIWKNDIGRATCVGGESVSDMSKRIIDTVRNIAIRHDGGTVVLVTHATPIRAISTVARGLDPLDMRLEGWVANASISIFEFDGTFRAIRTNIVSHLGGMRTELPTNV